MTAAVSIVEIEVDQGAASIGSPISESSASVSIVEIEVQSEGAVSIGE